MWDQMIATLKSFFIFPELEWNMILVAIGLGLAFGAFWLCTHWPPLFKRYWLWAVAIFSTFFTLVAMVFVQVPLQYWTGKALYHYWSIQTINTWLLLSGIPQLLISGLVQEGAKMVPIVFWWARSGRNISPKMGLAIGALAGAGFGIFEAVCAHNWLFASGWTLDALSKNGFLGIAGFWERFFAVGFHISASALAGYGLARGKGWQFYLIAAVLHFVMNYAVVFVIKGYFTIVKAETWVAVVSVLVTAGVLMLRWQKTDDETMEPMEPVEIEEPIEPVDSDV